MIVIINNIKFYMNKVNFKGSNKISCFMSLSINSNTSWVSFELWNILVIGWILFLLYQIGSKRKQFIKILIEDHPNLKKRKKNIILFSKLTYSSLVLLTVSLIIGDLWYDLSNLIFVTNKTASHPMNILYIVKGSLVLILKCLLIGIYYKMTGFDSWKFRLALLSLITFITWTILVHCDCLSLPEIFKACTFIHLASIYNLLGIPDLSKPPITVCHVTPNMSKSNMPSYDPNKPEESLPMTTDVEELQNRKRPISSVDEWWKATQGKPITNSMDAWWEANFGQSKKLSPTNIDSQNSQNNPYEHEQISHKSQKIKSNSVIWEPKNEYEAELFETPTKEECIEKMVDLDHDLDNIRHMRLGKEVNPDPKYYQEGYHPEVSKDVLEEEFREDKKILARKWDNLWRGSKVQPEIIEKNRVPTKPTYAKERLQRLKHGRYHIRVGANVRKDDFKLRREIFYERGESPLMNEIKNKNPKWK